MTDFGRRAAVAALNVLPKTGQTTSYRTGDDGYYEAGWEGDRFTDNGDGTITDNATSLMWPDDGANPGANNGNKLNWDGCIDYAEALDWNGHSDWRLPNTREFSSLLDYGTGYLGVNLIIQNAQINNYWTSTSVAWATTNAWLWFRVSMYHFTVTKSYHAHLLCCRDA